jgi:hypothetical protein
MDTGQDLDRALAEALGERVCGGEAVLRLSGITGSHGEWWGCTRCHWAWGAREKMAREHGPYPPYSTSWEAAGRLCEVLRGRGWLLALRALPRGGWRVWLTLDDGSNYWETEGPSAPGAIALAALRALGREGEREQTRR